MPRMFCEQCNEILPIDNPRWKTMCFKCFIRTKREEEGDCSRPVRTASHGREDSLLTECMTLRTENERLRSDVAHLTRVINTLRNAPTPAVRQTVIGADMLRRLIQLCHPDKHNGSESATAATQWLLKQKG